MLLVQLCRLSSIKLGERSLQPKAPDCQSRGFWTFDNAGAKSSSTANLEVMQEAEAELGKLG
jgi:hypothetical protein